MWALVTLIRLVLYVADVDGQAALFLFRGAVNNLHILKKRSLAGLGKTEREWRW